MYSSDIKRVAVGMSGGVDSSVTAAMLIEQGYEVTGVFMECWRAPGCRVDEDRRDAMDVAMKLGISFEVLDFKKEYKAEVVDYFYREYAAGRTPNPDTMCNKEIKFGMFYEEMIEKRGYDYIATGHYAINDNGMLLKGVDEKKDQSYFLYLLRQEQLEHVLFPLGEITKGEVREKARELGLQTAEKPDSQGICFIGEVSVKDFLMDLGMEEKIGAVIHQGTDLVVGIHDGAWFYTVGQRVGLNHASQAREHVGNLRNAGYDPAKLPSFFVIEKDVEKNVLVVGEREELYAKSFEMGDMHYVDDGLRSKIHELGDLRVRIRHGGELVGVKEISPQGRNDNALRIVLEKSVFGVAPGQACVVYVGDRVMGGGIIA